MFAYTAREAVFAGVTPFLDPGDLRHQLLRQDVHRHRRRPHPPAGPGPGARRRPGHPPGPRRRRPRRLPLRRAPGRRPPPAPRPAPASTPTHLVISATHTHGGAGPIWPLTHSAYGILGGDLFDPRVFGRVADGITASVIDAVAALEPAEGRRRHAPRSSTPPTTATSSPTGSTPTSRRRDRGDGKPGEHRPRPHRRAGRHRRRPPLGLWTTFAIHGTAFGDGMLHFTGDNQAYAERIVEDEIRRRPGSGPTTSSSTPWPTGPRATSPRTSPPPARRRPDGALPAASTTGREPDARYVVGDYAGAEIAGERVAHGALEAWEQAGGRHLSDDVDLDALLVPPPLDGSHGDRRRTRRPDRRPRLRRRSACPDGTALPLDLERARPGRQAAASPSGCRARWCRRSPRCRWCGSAGCCWATTPFEVTKQMGARIEAADGRGGGPLATDDVALVGLAGTATSPTWRRPRSTTPTTTRAASPSTGASRARPSRPGLVQLVDAAGRRPPRAPGSTALLARPRASPTCRRCCPSPTSAWCWPSQLATMARFGQAAFGWVGGDPAADDPHVRLERLGPDGTWRTVTTDDGLRGHRHPRPRPLGRPATAGPRRGRRRRARPPAPTGSSSSGRRAGTSS